MNVLVCIRLIIRQARHDLHSCLRFLVLWTAAFLSSFSLDAWVNLLDSDQDRRSPLLSSPLLSSLLNGPHDRVVPRK